MKNSILIYLTCALLRINNICAQTSTAPIISPSTNQAVLINKKEKLIFSVVGGKTATPTDGCPPWTPGSQLTVWSYGTFIGTPEKGTPSSSSSLTLNKNIGGTTTVSVLVQQKWTDSQKKTVTQISPSSSSVTVIVQIPTTLVFKSSYPSASGGSYVFIVNDQYGNSIKNQNGVQLIETVSNQAMTAYAGIYGHSFDFQASQPIIDRSAAIGTDGSGTIIDTPVGVNPSDLEPVIRAYFTQYNVRFNALDHTLDHSYKIGYDSQKTATALTQSQVISYTITWDQENKPTIICSGARVK